MRLWLSFYLYSSCLMPPCPSEQEAVEISQYEMGQPFKTRTRQECSVTAFAQQDVTGHLRYGLFHCSDFSRNSRGNPVIFTVPFAVYLMATVKNMDAPTLGQSFTLTIKSSNKNEVKGETQLGPGGRWEPEREVTYWCSASTWVKNVRSVATCVCAEV